MGSGVSLPDNSKYTVKICIGDFSIETGKPKEHKDQYCRWSERFDVQRFKAPYKSMEELERVYIYLMSGSDAICFWKGNCADYLDPNP